MATRLNRTHDAKTRDKIKTSQLINRLYSFTKGEIELTNGQIRGIEILLKKTLPDLSSVAVTGDDENPVAVTTKIELVGVPAGGDK